MSIRDREIERVVKYAQGLGIRIKWKKYTRGDPGAMWSVDGTEITMYVWPRKSKTHILLDFVHEFAHHMAWIAADKNTPIHINRALDRDAEGTATKEHHKLIYKMERDDSRYQDRIFRELQLTIPRYKFLASRKLDLWVYERIWKEGKLPTEVRIREKRMELYEKYKRKTEA